MVDQDSTDCAYWGCALRGCELEVLKDWTHWAAVIGAGSLTAAALLRVDLPVTKPERSWYDGRAVAESVKTLAWRYAVGADPFPVDVPSQQADAQLVYRLRELPNELRGIDLVPTSATGVQITPKMRRIRADSLPTRKRVYEEGRVQDQQRWYATQATWNKARAERWNVIVLAAEVGGAVGALLRAADVIQIDLLGIAGAMIAGFTAWLQVKQHQNLASAYALASMELSSIRELVAAVDDETSWSQFVDQAEEAISREHTMWKASHSDRYRR